MNRLGMSNSCSRKADINRVDAMDGNLVEAEVA